MIWLVLIALIALASPVEATARYMAEDGATSGTCTTTGTACRFDRVVAVAACGDTITILTGDGVYTGANNMMNFSSHVPANPNCSLGNEITMQAETEGAVFFDGQFSLNPMWVKSMSYWKFVGFDAGNADNTGSGSVVIEVDNSDHITFQRIVASNLQYVPLDYDEDVLAVRSTTNSTFEDIGLFGVAGNLLLDECCIVGANSGNNTYRRIWARWEGHGAYSSPLDCGGPPFQIGYGARQNSTLENIITVYSGEQVTSGDCFHNSGFTGFTQFGSISIRDNAYPGDTGYKFRGWVGYGYDNPNVLFAAAWFMQSHGDDHGGTFMIDGQDMFIDGRSQGTINNPPFSLGCDSGACSGMSLNRLTAIRGLASNNFNNSSQFALFTNINECTSLASCPNFYTGSVGSTLGARNCFRYQDGTLTSTPLWPWPMDNRIKAALARAHAAGTGGTALSGTAGSGYAANTVTSEIVSRYGSIPTACLTGSSFTPAFPVASDFPSVSVRDDFDRANSGTLGAGWTELFPDVFSISSNEALAPSSGSGFARATYSDTKVQVDHEAYATWTTLSTANGYATMLVFGATDLTTNNQYRVRANRTSGSNTTVEVRRIDGVGGETVIMSGVDLGIESVDGNSFGVRVSGTTISVYWKWTDGIWYRIGQFTDSNLSSLPSTGVYVGMGGVGPSSINNFGAGPFVGQPVQSPPTPSASTGAGRFGTTFPGVR